MREGLSRGLLETIFALVGTVLVVLDSLVPSVQNGFTAGMALIGASATSYGLRYTKPTPQTDETPPADKEPAP